MKFLVLNKSHIFFCECQHTPHSDHKLVSLAGIFVFIIFLYFYDSFACDSGLCNCEQRSRKWSKLQLLTGTGLTLGQNTGVVAPPLRTCQFCSLEGKKGVGAALLEDWKQINVCYRPRQAGPVNCSGRVEQDKGKTPTNKLSLCFMLIDDLPSWLLSSFSLFLMLGLHGVRVGLGLFQAQTVNLFWCSLALYICNN